MKNFKIKFFIFVLVIVFFSSGIFLFMKSSNMSSKSLAQLNMSQLKNYHIAQKAFFLDHSRYSNSFEELHFEVNDLAGSRYMLLGWSRRCSAPTQPNYVLSKKLMLFDQERIKQQMIAILDQVDQAPCPDSRKGFKVFSIILSEDLKKIEVLSMDEKMKYKTQHFDL